MFVSEFVHDFAFFFFKFYWVNEYYQLLAAGITTVCSVECRRDSSHRAFEVVFPCLFFLFIHFVSHVDGTKGGAYVFHLKFTVCDHVLMYVE